MSKPQGLILVSDIHGEFKTLMALLDKCPKDRKLAILGDSIDRGKDSRAVVEWAMKNRIAHLLGNHEHMAIDYHVNQLEGEPSEYQDGVWLMNGGISALQSFTGKEFVPESRIKHEIIAWMQTLPLHIIPKDYPDLLLTHSGHGLITKDSQHSAFDAVWARSFQFPKDGLFRVFGHTQQRQALLTDTYACIDTGCAYGGHMTAMLWPEKTFITQGRVH